MIGRRWVWVDIETSGLDPDRASILEVGLVVTDEHLNEIASFTRVVYHDFLARNRIEVDEMDDVVREMHTKSGLLDDMRKTVWGSNAAIETDILVFLMQNNVDRKTSPMCGSSPHFDRAFLRKHMPDVEQHFHYRNIDVSTLREMCKAWYPLSTLWKEKHEAPHRALADLRGSIAELRTLRDTFLVRLPNRPFASFTCPTCKVVQEVSRGEFLDGDGFEYECGCGAELDVDVFVDVKLDATLAESTSANAEPAPALATEPEAEPKPVSPEPT